jgi:hypothetical protein
VFDIKLDTYPLEQYENDLDKFGKQGMPYAIRGTLNTAAYKASDLSKKKVGQLFTIRNTFVQRSIRFQKTFSRRIEDMESAAGSTEDFMRKQTEGFTEHTRGKHGVPLPTSAAAGQEGAKPRTRVIRRSNWINRLKVAKRIREKYKNTKQAVIRRVQDAVESGDRTIFLGVRGKASNKYKKGFYRVLGGRRVKRGWPTGARLRMLYSMEHTTLYTRARDWLGPPTRFVTAHLGDYYRDALIRQIEKQRAFRNRG